METLSAGERLAERYQIEDLMGEAQRSQVWRAVDDVLNRSVSVQVVPSDDPAAEALLIAARRATAVEDPRFLRVLDAAHENGYAYVVREWASGVSLDTVLREGPLPAARSVAVVREVAEAVANAHRAGVHHRRLDPSRVLVKHNGAVRVLGLATDQAMYAPDEDAESTSAAEAADVHALGQLLYACLVARWPGERDLGLLMAPTEHGRLLRPRQVRAGVDPATDAICDRILGIGPRQAGRALRTAAQVAHELAVLTTAEEPTRSFAPPVDEEEDRTIPRGVLPVAPSADGPPPALNHVPPPRANQAAPVGTESPPPGPRRRTGARVAVWLAVVLLVAISGVIGFFLLPDGTSDEGNTDPERTEEAGGGAQATEVLDIAAVDDFDPLGSDEENPESVGFTFDGDPSTAWTTVSYFSELKAQKEGVGLLVDLGRRQDVDSVDLRLVGGPTAVEVYAAPDGAGTAPTSVDRLDLLGESSGSTKDVLLRAESPFRTQYLVVWLTSLPEVEPGLWIGSVAEITVRG